MFTKRFFSSTSANNLRHLVSIGELTTQEFQTLVNKAQTFKELYKHNDSKDFVNNNKKLLGKTVALVFSKRSTRTRISSEGAAAFFGAQPMFLGKDDIQLGVNESFYDTTKVLSSMVSAVFARVNSHLEIQQLVQHSSVPIINSLCDTYHPLQAIADILTIKEAFKDTKGLKLAWIGDSNNVINDLAIASLKLGINVSVATPNGIELDSRIINTAQEVTKETGAVLELTHDSKVAAENADILVTDTFVSMGQESEKIEKLRQFEGFQISEEHTKLANKNWKFMHCLPRHKEEVTDEVFYSKNSLVFEEAENRLYAAIAALEVFVVNKGDFSK